MIMACKCTNIPYMTQYTGVCACALTSQNDVQAADGLRRRGEEFIENDHYAVDCIRPKCAELQRVCEQYRALMRKQRQLLAKSRQLHQRIEQVRCGVMTS